MIFQLSAACGSNIGLVRRNNEDNFFFSGRHMSQENRGMRGYLSAKRDLTESVCFAVFDGMGGEACGEVAAFLAAQTMAEHWRSHGEIAESPRDCLDSLCQEMNTAVYNRSEELCVGVMGTTAVILLFVPDEVYICNLGDSRAYRLRDDTLMQISTDDLQFLPPGSHHKPGITQYLGMCTEDMILSPHIVKGNLHTGDVYLICSDGVTDMLTNAEICGCLRTHISPKKAAEDLIRSALKNGGKDNATAIVVRAL